MLQGNFSRLDIAICRANLRLRFSSALQSIKLTDDSEAGRGDNFVRWIIEHSIKLLNFEGHPITFTRLSAVKMANGLMRLQGIKELVLDNGAVDKIKELDEIRYDEV